MNKKHLLTIIAALSCGLSAMQLSADPGRGGHDDKNKFMAIYDANQDARVTLEEFNAESARRFDQMDTDSNGMLTPEEFSSYVESRGEAARLARFQAVDSNRDGSISQAEYLESARVEAEKKFRQMDADNNAQLSGAEFGSRGDKDCDKPEHGKGRDGKGKYGKRDGGGFFSRIDTNKDGLVSRDESIAAWSSWFRRIDANNDQIITVEEVDALRGKMHD